jgi:class 3 adenylate cyclase
MFTDLVGYGAMTQRNEDLALELLQLHREILRPLFRSNGGNEIKTIGDAFLVEFQSALQATRCAIAIQRELKRYNGSVTGDRIIQIRIGLHIGDVVFEQNDVYGDGVNLASRIYAQAPPGGICITRSVYDQVYNKLDVPLRRLGPQRLKSIQKPVELFAIELEKPSVTALSPFRITVAVAIVLVIALAGYYVILGSTQWPFNRVTTPQDTLSQITPQVNDSTDIETQTPDSVDTDISNPDTTVAVQQPPNDPPIQNTSEPDDAISRLGRPYVSITGSATWYDLQRSLRRATDEGMVEYFASRDSLSSIDGVLVAIIENNQAPSTPIDAYLVYNGSRYVNLNTRQEISNLADRYPGKRAIWIRSTQ